MDRIPESTHFREETRAVWCHKPVTKASPSPASCPSEWPQFTQEAAAASPCREAQDSSLGAPGSKRTAQGGSPGARCRSPGPGRACDRSLRRAHRGPTLPENLS